MEKCFVVELTGGREPCWLAPWDGDPGRTMVFESALKFKSRGDAENAKKRAEATMLEPGQRKMEVVELWWRL